MKQKRFGFIAELAAILVVLFIATVYAGSFWQTKNIRISGTAGETLATGDAVCIKAADSKIWKADADDSSLRPAIGVIGKGGAAGATVEIVMDGILTGQTSASPGARVYLSATTAGALTTTVGTNAQPMGFVMPQTVGTSGASTIYYVRPVIVGTGGAGY
ncbi:MAG: hypothetical protein ABSC54_00830 [Smithellaceae bacterium]